MTQRADTVLASWAKTAASTIQKLERHNIEGHWAPSSADAVELVRSWMSDDDSVTWGGSETFKETGMKAALEGAGCYRMLDRTRAVTPEEQRQMWCDRTTATWFFMSANALTLDGELVNIDGNSDRCSLLLHGPEHVVVLCGMNKLVADVDAAIKRIRTTVCPLNAERLHTETPSRAHGCLRRLPCAEVHVLQRRGHTPQPPRRTHQGCAHRRGVGILSASSSALGRIMVQSTSSRTHTTRTYDGSEHG